MNITPNFFYNWILQFKLDVILCLFYDGACMYYQSCVAFLVLYIWLSLIHANVYVFNKIIKCNISDRWNLFELK